jgi:hypothetical protein
MNWQARSAEFTRIVLLPLAMLAVPFVTCAREKVAPPPFKYVGGTEDVSYNCRGEIQLRAESLAFQCSQYRLAIPYSSISLMQYRPDVAKRVKKMKLDWKVRLPRGGGKKNHYFTVLYNQGSTPHVIVLEASPEVMRPYLAEIDLRAGKRVEVRGYED